MKRIRLSEWARKQGISRTTAYRMLQRGILPVPAERSPTGRWYVLVAESRIGRSAIYARATPGRHHVDALNHQIADVSQWASSQKRTVFAVVKEVANPLTDSLPYLERLLLDVQVTEIIVHNPDVLGLGRYALLVAALAPQHRAITTVHPAYREDDLEAAIETLVARMV